MNDIDRPGSIPRTEVPTIEHYLKQMLSPNESPVKRAFQNARQKVNRIIGQQSYKDLAELTSIVKENAHNQNIVSRIDLEEAFSAMEPFKVLTASALSEDEGPQETMLYLLGYASYIYDPNQLISRFCK